MSRMMPAKIRAEGAELYKSGLVTDVEISELKLTADVDGEQVVYDLDGQDDTCFCELFQQTGRYCKHIAAIEEYLKHGRSEEIELARDERLRENERSLKFEASSVFLRQINTDLNKEPSGHFDIEVDLIDAGASDLTLEYPDHFVVTLRLRENGAAKSYIIRDIPSFLKAIQKGGSYSLGQFYYNFISLENFDAASRELLDLLFKLNIDNEDTLQGSTYRKNGRYLALPFALAQQFLQLVRNLSDFNLKIGDRDTNDFNYSKLDGESELFKFTVSPQDDRIELTIYEAEAASFYKGRLLFSGDTFYQLTGAQAQLREQILWLDFTGETRKVYFSYDDKDALALALQVFETLGTVTSPEAFKIRTFRPIFTFSLDKNRLQLEMKFDYGDFMVTSLQELETLEYARDLRLERRIFNLLTNSGFQKDFETYRAGFKPADLYTLYEDIIPAFEALGQVVLDSQLSDLEVVAEPDIEISRQGSLLDISFSLPELEKDELDALLSRLAKRQNHYITQSGKLVKLDKRFDALREAITEFDDIKVSENHLTTGVFRSFQISKIFENAIGTTFTEKFDNLYRDLTHPSDFAYQKPKDLTADLRNYQEDGVRWMNMLTHYGLGGILADDMGLGKTLQAIAYLLSNFESKGKNSSKDKALIVAPSSLLYNWQAEFEKFSKGLSIAVIDGTRATREKLISEPHQIYISSYGSFLKDVELYRSQELTYLLLDEAQAIKNFNSKTNKALSKLTVDHVFALSGTPIENKIDEIWSIFNIIMPGFLSSRKSFVKKKPSEILRQISPFVLRRKKEDVLTELPDRLEYTQLSDLTEAQKKIYLAQLENMQQQLQGLNRNEFSRKRIEILAGITRLRQICDSPALFMDDYEGGSGKLDSLKDLLQQVKDSGRRPLIFSQFTRIFPFIEELLDEAGLSYYKLTGSTPSRSRIDMVRAFNAGSRDVFLISLKAGGTGLNLASSDMVILVDLWWNPAVEDQAISRAHRMGQKNMVEVIRLITKGTIEEKIIEIQNRKKDLFTAILNDSSSAQSLSQAEINDILSIKP